jgi:hypothetical protein
MELTVGTFMYDEDCWLILAFMVVCYDVYDFDELDLFRVSRRTVKLEGLIGLPKSNDIGV